MARHLTTLRTVTNVYGDLQICRSSPLPLDPADARAALGAVLASATRGVWLQLGWDRASLFPLVAELGFVPFSAVDGVVTLQAWCAPGPNPTPVRPWGVGCRGVSMLRVKILAACHGPLGSC